MVSKVHLEIPADDMERVSKFYAGVMGWTTKKVPGMDYTMVYTGPERKTSEVTAGVMPRRGAEHRHITAYLGVDSVDERVAKVKDLGGKILMQKTAIPGYGWFAICRDTEGNRFALWEEDKAAK